GCALPRDLRGRDAAAIRGRAAPTSPLRQTAPDRCAAAPVAAGRRLLQRCRLPRFGAVLPVPWSAPCRPLRNLPDAGRWFPAWSASRRAPPVHLAAYRPPAHRDRAASGHGGPLP